MSDSYEKVTLQVFATFNAIFPIWDLAMSGKTNHAVQIWSKSLRNYTPDEIKRGLESCEDLTKPPSLGQFRALCRPPRPKLHAGAYQRLKLPSLQQLRSESIPAKCEIRLIFISQGKRVKDYDVDTEKRMDIYYVNRPASHNDHEKVKSFLSVYRRNQKRAV